MNTTIAFRTIATAQKRLDTLINAAPSRQGRTLLEIKRRRALRALAILIATLYDLWSAEPYGDIPEDQD